jgi:phosphonate dehydrogenase
MYSQRPKVVISTRVDERSLVPLAKCAEVVINKSAEPWSRAELVDKAREAFGLMAFMPDMVDDEMLASCPSLRIIAGAFKGYDNVDVESCTRRGVWVTVVPDLLSAPTADLAVALLLALSRHVNEGDRLVRNGFYRGWRPVLYGKGLDGAVVGIIGMGALGQAIARRLAGFGCRLVYFDKRPLSRGDEHSLGLVQLALNRIRDESDFLILALPLNEFTTALVDRSFLSKVKPGCLMINVARGSLVDEDAVAEALETGNLGGYAADVYPFEDLRQSNRPNSVSPRLLADVGQTVFTPHLGSAVEEVRFRIAEEAALNILDCIDGRRPRGAVNSVPTIASAQK